MPSQRQTQVAKRLREEIAQIILRGIEDPRVRLVTVTDVSVSDSLINSDDFNCDVELSALAIQHHG